jgi:BirA family biotin operon repressor/biotin-[acetyl-CoA-carboxylase] ligase
MNSPLSANHALLELDETDSTQIVARHELHKPGGAGVVLTHIQTAGVGRFGRPWISGRDDSLTMTMIFRDYPNHPQAYLIGMEVALAAAGAAHSQIQWPNDLVIEDRKVGGILTEIVQDSQGRNVALVGLGVNLNQRQFPAAIADRAVSLSQAHGGPYDPVKLAHKILERLASLPEPNSWDDLAAIWALFDRTPGKRYKLPDGQEGIALGVGSAGQLICSVNGESQTVLAADAIFGPAS